MKPLLKQTKSLLGRDYLKTLLVFLFFFTAFSLIYFSLNRFVSHDDGFFHIRFAELIRQQGWGVFAEFPWLAFSKIAPPQTYFIYYNFLFYLFLIPFTFFQPLFIGLKMAAITIGALVFTVLYHILLKLIKQGAFWWTLATFALIGFGDTVRTIMGRPFALAPVLLLLLLYLLQQKKYLGVVLVTVLYFYWHSATFFFPLGVAVVYMIFEKFYRQKIDWRNFWAVLVGTASAIIATVFLAPGFFTYMKDVIFRTVYETILRQQVNIQAGSELYPSDAFNFLLNHQILIPLLILAGTWEIYQYIQWKRTGSNTDDLTKHRVLKSCLFTLSIGFLLLTFFSTRNADFFAFFTTVYIALLVKQTFSADQILYPGRKIWKLGISIAIIYLFVGKSLIMHSSISKQSSYYLIEGAAAWLQENTPAHTTIFNAGWSEFTRLFYYNPQNYYVAGIEPRFLYDYDERLYWLWHNLGFNGYVCEQERCGELETEFRTAYQKPDTRQIWYQTQGGLASQTIKEKFKTQFILLDSGFRRFNELLARYPEGFELVYSSPDDPYRIYKIIQ